jgi:hypothetical protein
MDALNFLTIHLYIYVCVCNFQMFYQVEHAILAGKNC